MWRPCQVVSSFSAAATSSIVISCRLSSRHSRRGYAGLSATNLFASLAMSAGSSTVILIWVVLAGFLNRNNVGHVFRPFALSMVMTV
jgi:hypothetical protein